ncbi:hypothetical protein QBC34DRAFT_385796 [Podospora aff. communis PSN243]|uniref:MARVEL domain-containing protein n=1 Tax=Podospora aff. communis PSN243 TaxID=3040156 RepID=A0AAV9G6W6_9PEZI|nr:hypothetical protein QBC34DRAFT_385796 [Podospora aff. communis PSN243]
MLFAIFFAFWRFMEIVTLIPTVGMLAYFVKQYNDRNLLTPNYILVLFIVSVLGLAWALFTLFSYHRSSSNARFVGLVDLGFVGAFIAGVYYLRFIKDYDCVSLSPGNSATVSLGILGSATLNTLSLNVNRTCGMLKACFAFGIMNAIFFLFTAVMAVVHGGKEEKEVRKVRRSSSRRRSHSGSHRSRRSSHSHSRAYV